MGGVGRGGKRESVLFYGGVVRQGQGEAEARMKGVDNNSRYASESIITWMPITEVIRRSLVRKNLHPAKLAVAK